jgi:hypothetical protein
MLSSLFLFLPIFLTPNFSAKWVDQTRTTISIEVEQSSYQEVENCLNAGFELRYRYEIRRCRSGNTAYYQECSKKLLINKFAFYNPVESRYQCSYDLLGDDHKAEYLKCDQLKDVIPTLSRIDKLAIADIPLTGANNNLESELVVRVISDCRGDYPRFLARLGYILSFGLFRFYEKDSGEMKFKLEPPKQ